MTFFTEIFHRISEEFVQGRRNIRRWRGKEAGGQTDYADRQSGMWSSLQSSDARFWLTRVQLKLAKIEPEKFTDTKKEPGVIYVINRAEELGLCSQDMVNYLRGAFFHQNGLALVLDLKPAEE